MEEPSFRSNPGFRLDPPEHPFGVSCGKDGPAIGPVRLLCKSAEGFTPRPSEELDFVLGHAFARPLDCSDLLPRLDVIAKALNAGDLGRAMIATQFMRLPRLNPAEAERANAAEKMLVKASPDDPKHPGWPPGAPDSLGGKYRAKSAEEIAAAKLRIRKRVTRRAYRSGLRTLLRVRRLGLLFGDAASNLVPGLGALGDIEAVYEAKKMIDEFEELHVAADAALEFAEGGPRTLEELQVSAADESFPNMDAFEKEILDKRFGKAGPGYEYHHIVEQGAGDLPREGLHSTRNIIRIPKLLHEEVTAEFASKLPKTEVYGRVTVRKFLRSLPYQERYQQGLEILRKVGILKGEPSP